MKCEKIKNQLSAYMDGELSEEHSAFVKKHLAVCANCSYEEQLLRKTSRLMESWEDVRAPDEFCETLLVKAENVSRLPRRSIFYAVRPLAGPRALIKVVAYGTAIILLCMGVIFFAMPPVKRATMVEPLSTYTESSSQSIDDITNTPEDSPKYTTMAQMKIAGMWK